MNVIDARTHPPESRGFARDRLDLLLSQIHRHRLTLVTAPPGSGKTTALGQFATTTEQRVAWYTADSLDGRADTFVAYLRQAIDHVCDLGDARVGSAVELAGRIGDANPDGLILVLDDFHLLSGQPAEDVVAELLGALTHDVHIVIASRLPLSVDISALRLTDDVFEITADDLRFRTWEAELLLAESYDLLLRPDDVARLTRQVAGWAAGLQLFHLVARGKPPSEQRRLIQTASTRSTVARQYFTNHVVGALPADLRAFLVPTSVLGVVRADLADDLLDRTGSEAELEQLERFGWFVSRIDDQTYRYHDVLRTHLESVLADQISPDELIARYSRAAELLEGAGFLGDAIRCRVRAGQTREVGRLVGRACREPSKATAGWLDVVEDADAPERGGDPWISLARARDEVGSGRFERACAFYRRAETLFGDADQAVMCRQERSTIDSFRDPLIPQPPAAWLGDLRRGLQRDPLGAARDLSDRGSASAYVASGALQFVAGEFKGAAEHFDAALLSDDVPDWAVDIGRLGHQLVRLVDGPADRGATLTVIDRLTGSLDRQWCQRLADAVVAMTRGASGQDDAARISERCLENGDPWGAAFSALCAGVATCDATAIDHFRNALRLAEEHSSWLLASWAHGGLARSVSGPESVSHAAEASRLARKMGLARSPIEAFLDLREPDSPAASVPQSEPGIVVRCFGEFRIDPANAAIDELRPRARELLMRLAMQIGHPVHRDRLVAELWAHADTKSAVRSLQVAVSSIRVALDAADAPVSIVRVDNAYLLTEPVTGTCDLLEFERLAAVAERPDVDPDTRLDAAHRAVKIHADELLTSAGTADWVLAERERLRLAAAATARRAARLALDNSGFTRAVEFSHAGLQHDRFDDGLWRAAIDAHRALGDDGTAEQLRRSYHLVLDELGVEATT